MNNLCHMQIIYFKLQKEKNDSVNVASKISNQNYRDHLHELCTHYQVR